MRNLALAFTAFLPLVAAGAESVSADELLKLCPALQSTSNSEKARAKRIAAEEALSARRLFSVTELMQVAQRRLEVGMPYYAPYCAWGRPSKVNITKTQAGTSYQLVYERYLGASVGSTYKFVYIDGDFVTAIQQ